jgi:glycosyltransferase involved in cell wall biosynthesis
MVMFSVIIPAHNEEKYIAQTIQSIQQQTNKDYEIIVVSNGCTDKTAEVVKEHAVKHFSSPHAHVSRARNYGAGKATGEILVFLDADTQLAVDALEIIKQQFTEEYSVATTRVKPDRVGFKYLVAAGWKNVHHSLGTYKGCSGALICRKDTFEKVNGYNPEITVREHRLLITALTKFGKYSCIPTTSTTSMRRWEKWGLGKVIWYWTKQWGKQRTKGLQDAEYEKIR